MRAFGITTLLLLMTLGCGRDDKDNPQAEAPTLSTQQKSPDKATQDEKLPVMPSIGLSNLEAITTRLGTSRLNRQGYTGCQTILAVLDNGFSGFQSEIGKTLPPDTEYYETRQSFGGSYDQHGLRLAQVAYAVATGKGTYDNATPGPRVVLINASGYTNLVGGIDKLISLKNEIANNTSSDRCAKKQVVALYAQIWEFGDRFINAQVNRATRAGVLWVNASGNYGKATYNGPIAIQDDGSLRLPHQKRYVRFYNPYDDQQMRIVLSWHDFDVTKDYRTPQDLKLVLETMDGQLIQEADRIQDGKDHGRDKKYSAHAREMISNLPLKKGYYRLRAEANSRNFDFGAKIRLSVYGAGIVMLDRTDDNSIFSPGNNPTVITVGAADVDYGSFRRPRQGEVAKPEVTTISHIVFDTWQDGPTPEAHQEYRGTSAATAIAAGFFCLVQGVTQGSLTRAAVLQKIKNQSIVPRQGFVDRRGHWQPPLLRL